MPTLQEIDQAVRDFLAVAEAEQRQRLMQVVGVDDRALKRWETQGRQKGGWNLLLQLHFLRKEGKFSNPKLTPDSPLSLHLEYALCDGLITVDEVKKATHTSNARTVYCWVFGEKLPRPGSLTGIFLELLLDKKDIRPMPRLKVWPQVLVDLAEALYSGDLPLGQAKTVLSRRLGKPLATHLSRWFNGEREPTPQDRQVIATYLKEINTLPEQRIIEALGKVAQLVKGLKGNTAAVQAVVESGAWQSLQRLLTQS